jgi:hypothetical protein
MNVEGLGTADSRSFVPYHVPRITIHSLTGETRPILHSKKDQLQTIRRGDYYANYRLLAAYLSYLDEFLAVQPKASTDDPAK